MKEIKIEQPALPVDDLVIDGVYKTRKNDMVKIKNIDKDKNELSFFNISDSCNYYKINLKTHSLVRRIR